MYISTKQNINKILTKYQTFSNIVYKRLCHSDVLNAQQLERERTGASFSAVYLFYLILILSNYSPASAAITGRLEGARLGAPVGGTIVGHTSSSIRKAPFFYHTLLSIGTLIVWASYRMCLIRTP